MRLTEWGGQLDVQHRAVGIDRSEHLQAVSFGTGLRRRPHLHVSLALRRRDAGREQVPGEDPLDRLVGADMERHAHRVRVAAAVIEARHKWDNRLPRDDKPEPELGRDRTTAAPAHLLTRLTWPTSGQPGPGDAKRPVGDYGAHG